MLTLVATYYPNLDFATICSGYADGLSTEDIQTLGESLLRTQGWWQSTSLLSG